MPADNEGEKMAMVTKEASNEDHEIIKQVIDILI
jgi:hypothetical protein